MKIFNKLGTKERLFEMFENVNKIKLNEADESTFNFSDTDTIYKLNNDAWEWLQVEKVNKGNNKKNVTNEWKFVRKSSNGNEFRNVGNPEVTYSINLKHLEKVGDESNMFESKFTNQKNEPLPDGINIPISSMENFTEDLLGRGVPSITASDETHIISRPDQINSWKESFIRNYGENGNLVKDDFFKKSFKVVGNESHANQMKKSNSAKKNALDNERQSGNNKMFDSYTPAMNEDSSTDVEIYDELEMRYSPSMKTISHNDISDVAQMYDMDDEDVAQIAAQVIADNQNNAYEEITNDVKDLIDRMRRNNIDYDKISTKSAWEVFEHEYEASSDFSEFEPIWNKLTKDPNQMNMFGESRMDEGGNGLKYIYDKKGNFIPKGFENSGLALRSIEQPMGSGNWKVGIVTLDMNGNMESIKAVKNDWGEAKIEIQNLLNN